MTTQTIRLFPSVLPQATAFAPKQAPTAAPRFTASTTDLETPAPLHDGLYYTTYGSLDSYRLHRAARLRRSAAMAQILGDGLQWLAAIAGRAIEAYRRHRDTHATFRALSELDTSTLRDLGFQRSELMSVAAEVNGAASPTRARALVRRRQFADRAYAHGTPIRTP